MDRQTSSRERERDRRPTLLLKINVRGRTHLAVLVARGSKWIPCGAPSCPLPTACNTDATATTTSTAAAEIVHSLERGGGDRRGLNPGICVGFRWPGYRVEQVQPRQLCLHPQQQVSQSRTAVLRPHRLVHMYIPATHVVAKLHNTAYFRTTTFMTRATCNHAMRRLRGTVGESARGRHVCRLMLHVLEFEMAKIPPGTAVAKLHVCRQGGPGPGYLTNGLIFSPSSLASRTYRWCRAW